MRVLDVRDDGVRSYCMSLDNVAENNSKNFRCEGFYRLGGNQPRATTLFPEHPPFLKRFPILTFSVSRRFLNSV